MKRIIIIAFLIAAPISYAMEQRPEQAGLSLPANDYVLQAFEDFEDDDQQIVEHVDKKAKSTPQYKCSHPDCVNRPLFSSSSGLRVHERSHRATLEEQRPHVCRIGECQERFVQAGHRDSHELTHTGQKQHICTLGDCTRSFSRPDDLKAHEDIVHLGMPGHKCNVCSRTFARKANLITHQRTHNGEKPYACSCGSRFARSDALKEHIKRAGSPQHTAIVAPQGSQDDDHDSDYEVRVDNQPKVDSNERVQRRSKLPAVIVAPQTSHDDDDDDSDDDDSDNGPRVDNQPKIDNEVTAICALVILHNQQHQQK